MPFVDVNGISAHHEIEGAGPPVVLLHGGFCSAAVMRPVGEQLRGYTVIAPERPGHGRTPDRPGPLSYADSLSDTLAHLDALGIGPAHVVGFSDGAILGLLLARDHPERVRSLVAISANLHPGPEVWAADDPRTDDAMEDAGRLLRLEHEALSPEPPGHADDLLARLSTMWRSEPQIGPTSLADVGVPTLVMAADRDTIALDHTRLVADSVPGAQLCVVPGATHMLVRERPRLVGLVVAEFLAEVSAR